MDDEYNKQQRFVAHQGDEHQQKKNEPEKNMGVMGCKQHGGRAYHGPCAGPE